MPDLFMMSMKSTRHIYVIMSLFEGEKQLVNSNVKFIIGIFYLKLPFLVELLLREEA